MAATHGDEFKRDAVRIALTSGLTRRQVASDLGVGLSTLGSYGRPRMTEELNELGLRVGQRRVGRLMRQNGIRIIRSRKFKRTTDSDHAFNIAPNLLRQDFTASGPNQNRRSTQRNGPATSASCLDA